MRKKNPADVRTDFANSCAQTISHFDRTALALNGTPNEKQDLSLLSEETFLVLYVGYERFVSDLFLAYLNRDFSRYRTYLEARFSASVEEKFGSKVLSYSKVTIPKHVPLEDIEQVVDKEGKNLTFPTVARMKERAHQWLAVASAARVNSITASEERLIDTAHAIRDFLSHRSKGSKTHMNDALFTIQIGGHNPHLGRGPDVVHNLGAFLKVAPAGRMRLHRYSEELCRVSAHM